MISDLYLILDIEMKLLQVCGPIFILVIPQFSLCLHELRRLLISVDDHLILDNVILPLTIGLFNGI